MLEKNAGANVAQSQVPAKTFVGLETIAVGEGPAISMEAVTERLEEKTAMSAQVSTIALRY